MQHYSLPKVDLVSVWIFFNIEKVRSQSALEFGMVHTADTILVSRVNMGVPVILLVIFEICPQYWSTLVEPRVVGSSDACVTL